MSSASEELVSMSVAGHYFGIPVLQVQDVLAPRRVTRVPLAPPEVAGVLNLRGRIVTVVNLRRRLGLEAARAGDGEMHVVVEHEGEPYSLLVDSVGDVLRLAAAARQPNPATLDPVWADLAAGIHRLDNMLLVVLQVARLIDLKRPLKAA